MLNENVFREMLEEKKEASCEIAKLLIRYEKMIVEGVEGRGKRNDLIR